MIRIYMDESGTHDDSPVVAVSAYSARPKVWREFEKQWNIAKRPIEVFHSTDCEALRGEFEGCSEEDRNKLVASLLPLLSRFEIRGNAIAINKNDFNEAARNHVTLDDLFGSGYEACFQVVIENVLYQMERHHNNEALAFFHEQNDYQSRALEAFNFVKINRTFHSSPMTLTFAPKNKFVPLQAADVLAYEANKRARDQTRPKRRSIIAMDPNDENLHIGIIDKTNLQKMMRKLVVTKREIDLLGRPSAFWTRDDDG